MKRQPIQPPLLGVVERMEIDRSAEITDIMHTLAAVGITATEAQAAALYEEGMRGVGCYVRSNNFYIVDVAARTELRLMNYVQEHQRKEQ